MIYSFKLFEVREVHSVNLFGRAVLEYLRALVCLQRQNYPFLSEVGHGSPIEDLVFEDLALGGPSSPDQVRILRHSWHPNSDARAQLKTGNEARSTAPPSETLPCVTSWFLQPNSVARSRDENVQQTLAWLRIERGWSATEYGSTLVPS